MEPIALIVGDCILRWSAIVLTLAASAAVCVFLSCYLNQGGSGLAAAAAVPMAMAASLVLARLCHWYFRPDSYPGFIAAMTDYTAGGYALMGCFFGCGLTVLALRLLKLEREPLRLSDAMCMAAAAGICLGRLANIFTGADRGQLVGSGMLWSSPVTNAATGQTEYRFATFLFQSAGAGLVFLVLGLFFRKRRQGDATLLFFLLYGLPQILLDSTRYDPLTLRSNGFLRAVQLLNALAVAAVCICLALRLTKTRGFRLWQVPLWAVMAALLGTAGYMEYVVQRHGNHMLFGYGVMAASLAALGAAAIGVYCLCSQKPQ